MTEFVFALSRAMAHVEQRVNKSLAAWRGTSLTEVRLLAAIGDGITRRDLAAELAISAAATSKLTGPLERQGFITIGDANDPRERRITLTDHGRSLLDDAFAVIDEVSELLGRRAQLTDDEMATMMSILAEFTPAGSLARGPRIHQPRGDTGTNGESD